MRRSSSASSFSHWGEVYLGSSSSSVSPKVDWSLFAVDSLLNSCWTWLREEWCSTNNGFPSWSPSPSSSPHHSSIPCLPSKETSTLCWLGRLQCFGCVSLKGRLHFENQKTREKKENMAPEEKLASSVPPPSLITVILTQQLLLTLEYALVGLYWVDIGRQSTSSSVSWGWLACWTHYRKSNGGCLLSSSLWAPPGVFLTCGVPIDYDLGIPSYIWNIWWRLRWKYCLM